MIQIVQAIGFYTLCFMNMAAYGMKLKPHYMRSIICELSNSPNSYLGAIPKDICNSVIHAINREEYDIFMQFFEKKPEAALFEYLCGRGKEADNPLIDNEEILEKVLAKFTHAEVKGHWLCTGLALSSGSGHLAMCTWLHKRNAEIDYYHYNPLLRAIPRNHLEIVQFWLKNGVNPNFSSALDSTPLTLAISNKNPHMISLLLDHRANIHHQSDQGDSVLLWTDSKKIIKLLLDRGVNINHCNKDGLNRLMMYVIEGEFELVKFFIENGADIHYKTPNGNTALSLAIMNGHHEIADLLRKYGAEWDIC